MLYLCGLAFFLSIAKVRELVLIVAVRDRRWAILMSRFAPMISVKIECSFPFSNGAVVVKRSSQRLTKSGHQSPTKSSRGLPSHEALLGKIERQFDRLEDELDVLEATMIRTGWMPDPVEERKAARSAAKAARLAAQDLAEAGEVADSEDSNASHSEGQADSSFPRKPR